MSQLYSINIMIPAWLLILFMLLKLLNTDPGVIVKWTLHHPMTPPTFFVLNEQEMVK